MTTTDSFDNLSNVNIPRLRYTFSINFYIQIINYLASCTFVFQTYFESSPTKRKKKKKIYKAKEFTLFIVFNSFNRLKIMNYN